MNYVNIQERALWREALQETEDGSVVVCPFCRVVALDLPWPVCATQPEADECKRLSDEAAKEFS